jgi:hypothetical protein
MRNKGWSERKQEPGRAQRAGAREKNGRAKRAGERKELLSEKRYVGSEEVRMRDTMNQNREKEVRME